MVRFSPISGATSAMVPMAAIFSSESMEIFFPARRINSQQSLKATPTPASSLNGYSHPGCFGFSTAAASGSSPGGRWWSVMMTSMPWAERATHRLDAGDAAIHCDYELYVPLGQHALQHFGLESVAVDEAMRDDEAGVRAEGLEDGLQQDDRGDAVDVVVAVDDDPFFVANSAGDALAGMVDSVNRGGSCRSPIAGATNRRYDSSSSTPRRMSSERNVALAMGIRGLSGGGVARVQRSWITVWEGSANGEIHATAR